MRGGIVLCGKDIAYEDLLDIFRLEACALNGSYTIELDQLDMQDGSL